MTFVQLTRDDNKIFWVNVELVTRIVPSNKGTKLHFVSPAGDDSVVVQESPSQVLGET